MVGIAVAIAGTGVDSAGSGGIQVALLARASDVAERLNPHPGLESVFYPASQAAYRSLSGRMDTNAELTVSVAIAVIGHPEAQATVIARDPKEPAPKRSVHVRCASGQAA